MRPALLHAKLHAQSVVCFFAAALLARRRRFTTSVNVNNIHMERNLSKIADWLGRAERKLDEHGKPAWIAAMVLGFVLVWPVGLAILGYMIWSGRMGCRWKRGQDWRARDGSGNTAFDDYRAATLRRLEEEQAAFADYLDRLRRAKDKAEFDGFIGERDRPVAPGPQPA